MGMWKKLRGEFIDIIEWVDGSADTMVWRFERYGNEIKNGAQLIVRPGQVAVFVNQGQIADVFQPGRHVLETSNLPILSTLMGWKYGFSSPFKAEAYFVATRQFTDLKWGTQNPVMLRDPEFGPVRLRAFGNYAVRVKEPTQFIREIVGADGHFTTGGITAQLRNMIITRFTDLLGQSRIPILDLASNYNQLGDFITEKLREEYLEYGIELTKFLVSNISLPPAVEEALDKRTSMGVLGDLGAYAQFQAANAMGDLAKNPGAGGGMAGGGMGMGMGYAMAQQLGQVLHPQQAAQATAQAAPAAAPAPAGPPPVPQAAVYYLAIGGQQVGPLSTDALQARAAAGEMKLDTLAWKQGMSNWAKVSEIPDLAKLVLQSPPPLPPTP